MRQDQPGDRDIEPATPADPQTIEVIIPNLHWRYTGVTAANRTAAPRIAGLVRAAWFGPDAPAGPVRLSAAGLLALRASRRPVIWHARRNNEMLAGLALKALGWPLRLVFTSAAQRRHTRFSRRLIARMDAVIATSEASASYLERPAIVIPHGVDADVFHPPANRVAAFAASGLPGRIGIGCFGRVRRQKGTDVFVEAMCRLLPRRPDLTAIIVGAITPDQQRFADGLRARAAATGLAGRIRFLGELPAADLPEWYRRISVFCFTSRVEGFGLTLLEAMASGAALVAARSGAAGIIVRDGETGILVPPGDPAALAEALDRLFGEPARMDALGRAARVDVLARFSAETEAERIVQVYRQLLPRSPHPLLRAP